MISRPRIQVGIAIIGYILFDALFRTTNGVWSATSNIKQVARLSAISTSDIFRAGTASGVGIIIAAVFSVLFMPPLIYLFLKVWEDSIHVTRILIYSLVSGKEQTTSEEPPETTALKQLFGENVLTDRNPLVWRLLRRFMLTWLLIIVIEIASNFIPNG